MSKQLSMQHSTDKPLSVLPELFLKRLAEIVDESDCEDCFASFSRTISPAFRINTLLSNSNDVLCELDTLALRAEPIHWCADAFTVGSQQRQQLTNSQTFIEGKIYIQNASSMLAPYILAPKPGEEVLDLAAAPGGKTLMMAAMMQNQGRIAAVEAVKKRFFKLKNNIKHYQASLVDCYLKDGRVVGRQCPDRFDRVLLDAPCSSESRFHSESPDSFKYWSERKIKEVQRKQKQLLYSAIQSVKSGGYVLYSTCSFAPEENEEVVSHLLKKFSGNLTVEPIDLQLSNFRPGRLFWRKKRYHPSVDKTVRVLPTETMKGFYLALLRKC